MQIPWEVRSAVIFADPGARAVSLMPWDQITYLAVTITPDYRTSWWLIEKSDDKEWSVAKVEADWENGGILVH